MRRSRSEVYGGHSFQLGKGFTLVETLVVTVLLFIIGGGLLSTFLTGQGSFRSGEAYVQVQQEARHAFDMMVRELREAKVSAVNNGVTGLPSGSNQLNFQVAQGYNIPGQCDTPSPSICWGSGTVLNHWIHYALVGTPGDTVANNVTQLLRCEDASETNAITAYSAASCRVLANYVRNIDIFSYDSANKIVTITLQVQYNDPKLLNGRQKTPRLTSRVRLRN